MSLRIVIEGDLYEVMGGLTERILVSTTPNADGITIYPYGPDTPYQVGSYFNECVPDGIKAFVLTYNNKPLVIQHSRPRELQRYTVVRNHHRLFDFNHTAQSMVLLPSHFGAEKAVYIRDRYLYVYDFRTDRERELALPSKYTGSHVQLNKIVANRSYIFVHLAEINYVAGKRVKRYTLLAKSAALDTAFWFCVLDNCPGAGGSANLYVNEYGISIGRTQHYQF